MKNIQIFKPGKHTSTDGRTLDFSEDFVSRLVASYDPALFPAPLVVGHPKLADPAFGWVKSLSFAEGVAEAEPEQINADFAELVKSGAFKKVSASIYLPDSPSNPKPGEPYLRHVGFLGAAAPAVKGLKAVEFAADDTAMEIEFGELKSWEVNSLASLFRTIREWVISRWDKDEADKAIPSYLVEDIERAASRPTEITDEGKAIPSYAESPKNPPSAAHGGGLNPSGHASGAAVPNKESKMPTEEKTAEFAEKMAALEAKETELKARETKVAAGETAQRKAGFVAFCEEQIKAGKLTPALKPGMVEFLEALHTGTATVEFGEGEAKKSQSPVEFFKSFVEALPKAVTFGEIAGGTKGPADGKKPVEFAAAPGFVADPEGLEELGKAQEYAEAHKCSLLEAVSALKTSASGKE